MGGAAREPLRRRRAFASLVAAREFRERDRLANEVVESLHGDDVRELLAFVDSGAADEQRAAMRILRDLAERADPRLGSSERQQWLGLARRIVDAEYPRLAACGLAYDALYRFDFAAAVDALTRTVDLRSASAIDYTILVTHLGDLANKGAARALERLAELRALGGPAGEAAGEMLDRFDPDKRRQRTEELLRAWRERRSADLLGELYHGPVGALLLKGTTRRELVELLGPPDLTRKGAIWYQPSDGTALSVHFDEKGKAVGWHMT